MTRIVYVVVGLLVFFQNYPALAACPIEEITSYSELSEWVKSLDKGDDYVDLVISGCGLNISKNVGINRGIEQVWQTFAKFNQHDFVLIPLLAEPCEEFQCFGLSSEQFVRAANAFREQHRLEEDRSRKNSALFISLGGMVIAIISLAISIMKFRKETADGN